MMQQYLKIKEEHRDALLMYRMGDFYELFMEDAVEAARILEIALTSRDKNAEEPIPMCGVPYHAAENYMARLVAAGKKVAVCDQVEDPRTSKGLVKREVTRIITPGLILDSRNLSAKNPNYLAAVSRNVKNSMHGLAYLDVSTAEFKIVQMDSQEQLLEELLRVSPREILLPDNENPPWLSHLQGRDSLSVTRLDTESFHLDRARERLCEHFKVHSLEGFGIDQWEQGIEAAGAILQYAEANLFDTCSHIRKILPYRRSDHMVLDEATVRNLEIFESASFPGKKGSLLAQLDETRTAMGGRRFQQWLRYPLLEIQAILMRQEGVAELVARTDLRMEIMEHLGDVQDMERLNARNTTANSNARDLVSLKKSLQILPHIREALQGCNSEILSTLAREWDDLKDVAQEIERVLVDPPPATMSGGGIIKTGVDPELDHAIHLSRNAKDWMADYESGQRRDTGIGSLKVRYNKVFGYYIEVSKAHLHSVPGHYERKQTLVNAERFITDELKEFESQVLEADEKRLELEHSLFVKLQEWVGGHCGRLQDMAERVAIVDCLTGLALTASRNGYCQPRLTNGDSLHIKEGRHPVIEHFLKQGEFVPNDLDLDHESQQVLIITGPNMAGKSTILRQAALIVLMAQVGGFVPASEAEIGVVDRIFTRVGASDDLARGRSTFMVEMQEAAHILHQATSSSLVILDEIGRGTSTFDGLSIAWAVAEHLHDHKATGIKTLFATHYHELTDLALSRPRVKNYNVAIKEWKNEIIFFHKLIPGGSSRSYGIQVAQLAGIPQEIISRAQEILTQLEKGEMARISPAMKKQKTGSPRKGKEAALQLSLFSPSLLWIKEQILNLDLDHMPPMVALKTLYALQEQIREKEDGS